MGSRTKEAATQERIDVPHRRYRIIAGRRAGAGVAIAYLGMRKIETVCAEDVEEAIKALKETLDRHVEHLKAERTGGVPSEAEYDEALQVLRTDLSASAMAVLFHLSRLPDASASLSELALRLGRSESAVTADAARIGRKLATLLDFVPDREGFDRSVAPLLAFAEVEVRGERASGLLRLRPEIVAPLRSLDQGEGRAPG